MRVPSIPTAPMFTPGASGSSQPTAPESRVRSGGMSSASSNVDLQPGAFGAASSPAPLASRLLASSSMR